jgi:PAS domain S-box-containing protein
MPFVESFIDHSIVIQEPLFKMIFENAAVGIAQINQNGRIMMANNKFSEITGYSKEELKEKTFQELTHPDDLEADLSQAEALFRGDINSYSMEKRYIRKDGSIVWVKLNGSAVFDEHRKFKMFVGVVEDISEKKNAEEALHVSEQVYKIASSAARIGAFFRNLETGENYWSPELLKIYGLKPDDPFPLKDGIPESVHPHDRESVLRLAKLHFDSFHNSEFNSEHRIILPDGKVRWINVRGVTEFNQQVKPFKTYGIVMDITGRKEVEEALRESEEKFRLLANNMSQLAWIMDDKGWVFWFNERWYEYTGTTFEEMQGWGWQKVHHPDHVKRVLQSKKQSVDSGEVWDELFPLRSKEGKYRWFLTRAVPLKDENGKIIHWLGTNTDVTHQRNIEKRLKNDNKLFEDLLYIAAHDLKSPVANLYGALDLMDSLPLEEKVKLLSRFRELADQLNITILGVTEILSMRSNDRSAASAINIEKLLKKILLEFNGQTDEVSIHPNILKPAIYYIELFLYSIIKNLVSNALKYRREDVPLSIEISTQIKDDYTLMSVRDNGIGIDLEAYGSKLFTPFYRLNPKNTTGTGMGLYLIKDIIEINGGYITVDSTPGKGTTFNCYLKEYSA